MNCHFLAIVLYFASPHLGYNVPRQIERILVRKPIKYSVASENNKVMKVRSNCKLRDFRLGNNNSFFTTILLKFSFNVSKSS